MRLLRPPRLARWALQDDAKGRVKTHSHTARAGRGSPGVGGLELETTRRVLTCSAMCRLSARNVRSEKQRTTYTIDNSSRRGRPLRGTSKCPQHAAQPPE